MKRRVFQGLPIVVENPAGSIRHWYDRAGRSKGSTLMHFDYGFVEGHAGSDGDELDCYLGPNEGAREVHVVHQLASPEFKRHDEDKVFLGFDSTEAARSAYVSHRNDGDRAIGGMSSMPIETFKAKLQRRSGSGKIRAESLPPKPARQGSAIKFDSLAEEGKVRTGVWDRICVPGINVKDDEQTEFSPETLTEMARNFAARGDMVMIDWNHQSSYAHENGQPAPALGFYGALAVVFDRSLVACEYARGVEQTPPNTAELEDGLWGLRSEVTECGHELLPSFKYVSPTFTPMGTDQQSNPIGYCLLAVAATNTPWQAGTQITFDRGVQTMAISPGSAEVGDQVVVQGRKFLVVAINPSGVTAKARGRGEPRFNINWDEIESVTRGSTYDRQGAQTMAMPGSLSVGDRVLSKGRPCIVVGSSGGGRDYELVRDNGEGKPTGTPFWEAAENIEKVRMERAQNRGAQTMAGSFEEWWSATKIVAKKHGIDIPDTFKDSARQGWQRGVDPYDWAREHAGGSFAKMDRGPQTMAYFKTGDRLRIDRDLKQSGWQSQVKGGTGGVVEDVDEGRMGTVAYKVRWDDGQSNWLINAHMVATKMSRAPTPRDAVVSRIKMNGPLKGAKTMKNVIAAAKLVGLEGSTDTRAIRAAFVQKFEDEAKKEASAPMYAYGDNANALEELAKAYEDANFEEEEEDQLPPHVVMRKMAAKFRKLEEMAAGDPPFGGKETPEEEAAEEASKHAKLEDNEEDAVKHEEDDAHMEDDKDDKKALQAMARKLGLPPGASAARIATAMEARTVGLDKFGALEKRIAEMEASKLSEVRSERRRAAEVTFSQAVAHGRTKAEKRDSFIAAYERNPKDAEGLLFTPGTFPSSDVLMSRMTVGGAPAGQSIREGSSMNALDQRIVTMSALGSNAKALVFGESLAAHVSAMADSEDPTVRKRIDRELPEGTKGTKFEAFERYMAAERITKKERPDLLLAASEDA